MQEASWLLVGLVKAALGDLGQQAGDFTTLVSPSRTTCLRHRFILQTSVLRVHSCWAACGPTALGGPGGCLCYVVGVVVASLWAWRGSCCLYPSYRHLPLHLLPEPRWPVPPLGGPLGSRCHTQ